MNRRQTRIFRAMKATGIVVAGVALGMFLSSLFDGCKIQPPSPPPDPLPEAGSTCQIVCNRFRQLDCEEAKPTHEGASCEMVCSNAEESGLLDINSSCVVGADSCAAASNCLN